MTQQFTHISAPREWNISLCNIKRKILFPGIPKEKCNFLELPKKDTFSLIPKQPYFFLNPKRNILFPRSQRTILFLESPKKKMSFKHKRNKLVKARKMRKPPVFLGRGKLWFKKVWAQNICIDFSADKENNFLSSFFYIFLLSKSRLAPATRLAGGSSRWGWTATYCSIF